MGLQQQWPSATSEPQQRPKPILVSTCTAAQLQQRNAIKNVASTSQRTTSEGNINHILLETLLLHQHTNLSVLTRQRPPGNRSSMRSENRRPNFLKVV